VSCFLTEKDNFIKNHTKNTYENVFSNKQRCIIFSLITNQKISSIQDGEHHISLPKRQRNRRSHRLLLCFGAFTPNSWSYPLASGFGATPKL